MLRSNLIFFPRHYLQKFMDDVFPKPDWGMPVERGRFKMISEEKLKMAKSP